MEKNKKDNNSISIESKAKTFEIENTILRKKIIQLNEKLIGKTLKELNEQYESIQKEIEVLNKKYELLTNKKNTEKNIEEETKTLIDYLNEKIDSQEKIMEDLNNEIYLYNNENLRLKELSKKIIEERNEIEIFFLDALDEVKREQYIKMKERAKRGNFYVPPKKKYNIPNAKIDIKSLTPEMKEKVLRNLFSKINEGYEPSQYKKLNDKLSFDLSNETI